MEANKIYKEWISNWGVDGKLMLHHPKDGGCPKCAGTGYKGAWVSSCDNPYMARNILEVFQNRGVGVHEKLLSVLDYIEGRCHQETVSCSIVGTCGTVLMEFSMTGQHAMSEARKTIAASLDKQQVVSH